MERRTHPAQEWERMGQRRNWTRNRSHRTATSHPTRGLPLQTVKHRFTSCIGKHVLYAPYISKENRQCDRNKEWRPSKWSIGSLLLVPVPTKIVTIPFSSSPGFILAPICSQNLISCPCCSLNEISLLAKLGRCSISCETPARI